MNTHRYMEDRSGDVGKSNIKKLKEGKGELKFTGVYIHTASACNLDCRGCYTKARKGRCAALDLPAAKRIVDFAADRGASYVAFAGAGEPLLDPQFDAIRKYIRGKGMETVLFTNCTQIKSRKQAKDLLLSGPVIGKLFAMNKEKHDRLVGRKGAFECAMRGITLLAEAKNELDREGRKPVIGIDAYATRQNRDELPEMLRFCRKNGFIPYFEAFIETGQKESARKDMALSAKVLTSLFHSLREIDRKEFGIRTRIMPLSRNYGQEPCRKATHMFSVRENGDVCMCVCTERKAGSIFSGKDPYEALRKIFDVRNKRLLGYLKCDVCSVRIGEF